MKMWEYGQIRSPQKVHFLDGIMVGKSGNGYPLTPTLCFDKIPTFSRFFFILKASLKLL